MELTLSNFLIFFGFFTTLAGIAYSIYKLFYRFKMLELASEARKSELMSESKARKEDTEIMLSALLAILDGLKEQGCNGTVKTTREQLNKYIIESR